MTLDPTLLVTATDTPAPLLWRLTALLALAWCAEWLARSANPRWRVLLWRATAVGVVAIAAGTFAPKVSLPVLPAAPAVAAPIATEAPPSSLRPQIPKPLHALDASQPSPAGAAPPAPQLEFAPASTGAPAPQPIESPTRITTAWALRAAWLVWLVGAAALLVRFIFGVRRVHRVAASAEAVPDSVLAAAQELAPACGVGSRFLLRQSDAAIAPCSAGIVRPIVLLPSGMVGAASEEDLRGAIAHELAHLSGRDLAWNALLELVAIALWFHPLAWRVRSAHADACDERCDAVAASVTSNTEGYAQLLARVALAVAERPPAAALPMARTPRVLRRIRLLPLGRGQTRLSRGRAAMVATLIAVGSTLLGVTALDRRAEAALGETATEVAGPAGSLKLKEEGPPLRGTIVDETGAPVTDARVSIMGSSTGTTGRSHYATETNDRGQYSFEEIDQADVYRLRVESKRWVGLTDWRNLPQLQLAPEQATAYDITLQRACVVRLRVVDAQGEPVRSGLVRAKNLASDRFSSQIDAVPLKSDGSAEVGGLTPSPADYRFGVSCRGYGHRMVELRLSEVGQTVEEVVVLTEGLDVPGVAICSDGKPATGWRLSALPKWWVFSSYPAGAEIGPDGAFTLNDVSPGEYDLSISIPTGGGMSRSVPVTSDERLPPSGKQLRVRINHPSPQGMGTISGKLILSGQAPEQMITVNATREDDRQYGGSAHLRGGQTEFTIEPLPPGRYELRVESTEIETVTLHNISAPRAGLEIPVEVRGRPRLVGRVVDGAGDPVTSFRVRVTKTGYLRGPNYVQDPQWIGVNDPEGRFSIDVVGPGIYRVTAAVDGNAPTTSDPLNTDTLPDGPITLRLAAGATLRGRVVDEAGDPVEGATVSPRSASPRVYSNLAKRFAGEERATTTDADGRFVLNGLPTGEELVRVTHPDYVFALSEEATLTSAGAELPPITLQRGGAVSGALYDDAGKPLRGVSLLFHDQSGYSGGPDEDVGLLASAVSDDAGRYKVEHLPEQLCYVHLAEEWDYDGVVRNAIMPADGETRTLDFGGPGGFVGRLLSSGEPVAGVRVQLGGENPHFGYYKSYARTDSEGRFSFGRPPAGSRTLWFQPGGRQDNWVRVTEVVFPAGTEPGHTVDLGDLNFRGVTLSVAIEGLTPDELGATRVLLRETDPYWLSFGNELGNPVPRASPETPAVFENVPPGDADATLYRQDGVAMVVPVDVRPDAPEQTTTVTWPGPTGSIEIDISPELLADGGYRVPSLRSADGRVHASVRPGAQDRVVRLERLPAGDYYFTDQDIRDARHLVDLRVTAGGTTEVRLTPKNSAVERDPLGLVRIRWFGPDGVPLVGVEGDLRAATGDARPRTTKQDREWSCVAPPGEYVVTGSFPGYKPLETRVTIDPPGPDGRIVGEATVSLTLPARD